MSRAAGRIMQHKYLGRQVGSLCTEDSFFPQKFCSDYWLTKNALFNQLANLAESFWG